MSEEEYSVPEKLQTLMTKSIALNSLRDSYVRVPFGFKKAKKLAIESAELREYFWTEIKVLYPELRGVRDLTYFDGAIRIIE